MTNAPNLTVAVKSVTYHENQSRTVEICCPVCQSDHTHVWPLSESQIGYRTASCNPSVGYVVQIFQSGLSTVKTAEATPSTQTEQPPTGVLFR
jgi:transposase-like protein